MTVIEQIKLSESGILPPLIKDYLSSSNQAKQLYKYPPDINSFKKVIEDKKNDKIDRALLVEVLQMQYVDIPINDLVKQNILSLANEKTFTVTTAHQPALFLGPLYYIYKIASTINLARQLKEKYPDHHFVPVFWMGSEDHDINELNHIYVNGRKVQWEAEVFGAIGKVPTKVVIKVLEELKGLVGDNELVQLLEAGVKRYETFGGFTHYFINQLFQEHGLVIIDQDNAELKRKFSEIILDEILQSRAVQVLTENLKFLDENYKVQASPRDINFFYLGDGHRERIVYDGAQKKYLVLNQNLSFTRGELISELENYPENFSPNVIYRPLFQELILPNLAFVGGSGELSYWLELKPLFEYYRVNFPALVLRSSAAIISTGANNKLQKLGMKPSQFFGDVEQVINKVIGLSVDGQVSLAAEKAKVKALFEGISEKAAAVDVTLKQNVAAEQQKLLNNLEALEGKMLKAEKRKMETTVNQVRAVHAALFPEGVLQERVENFIPHYNGDFIKEMVIHLNPLEQSFVFFLEN